MVLIWQLCVLALVAIIINVETVTCDRIMHAGKIFESEGRDRSDLNLPLNQLKLLQDVTALVTSELTCVSVVYLSHD